MTQDLCPFPQHNVQVASIRSLYLLKKSHIHWPKGFKKHIADLHDTKKISCTLSVTRHDLGLEIELMDIESMVFKQEVKE